MPIGNQSDLFAIISDCEKAWLRKGVIAKRSDCEEVWLRNGMIAKTCDCEKTNSISHSYKRFTGHSPVFIFLLRNDARGEHSFFSTAEIDLHLIIEVVLGIGTKSSQWPPYTKWCNVIVFLDIGLHMLRDRVDQHYILTSILKINNRRNVYLSLIYKRNRECPLKPWVR